MVLRGIQSVNARFGFEVGDSILRAFASNIETHLTHGDRLFRWDGPVVLALLDRADEIEKVRMQLRRVLDVRMEETFEVEGRTALIPISAVWSAFPLMPPLVAVIKQIQAFVAGQGCPDPGPLADGRAAIAHQNEA